MKAEYLEILLDSEEMQYYVRHFGGKKNKTVEKYRMMDKTKLLELYTQIQNKTCKLPKRERDLVTYYSEKA